MAQTLYEKIWNEHCVTADRNNALLYIDRHMVHEVTSPQAFEGLRLADRGLWRVSANLAVPDHNVPTANRDGGIADPISRMGAVWATTPQCQALGAILKPAVLPSLTGLDQASMAELLQRFGGSVS